LALFANIRLDLKCILGKKCSSLFGLYLSDDGKKFCIVLLKIAEVSDDSSTSTKLDDVKRQIDRKEAELVELSSNFDREESK
jgi:hypothetical protein